LKNIGLPCDCGLSDSVGPPDVVDSVADILFGFFILKYFATSDDVGGSDGPPDAGVIDGVGGGGLVDDNVAGILFGFFILKYFATSDDVGGGDGPPDADVIDGGGFTDADAIGVGVGGGGGPPDADVIDGGGGGGFTDADVIGVGVGGGGGGGGPDADAIGVGVGGDDGGPGACCLSDALGFNCPALGSPPFCLCISFIFFSNSALFIFE